MLSLGGSCLLFFAYFALFWSEGLSVSEPYWYEGGFSCHYFALHCHSVMELLFNTALTAMHAPFFLSTKLIYCVLFIFLVRRWKIVVPNLCSLRRHSNVVIFSIVWSLHYEWHSGAATQVVVHRLKFPLNLWNCLWYYLSKGLIKVGAILGCFLYGTIELLMRMYVLVGIVNEMILRRSLRH